MEDETRTQVLSIKKVTPEDLKRHYVCHARNAKGEVDGAATVKQKGNGCSLDRCVNSDCNMVVSRRREIEKERDPAPSAASDM